MFVPYRVRTEWSWAIWREREKRTRGPWAGTSAGGCALTAEIGLPKSRLGIFLALVVAASAVFLGYSCVALDTDVNHRSSAIVILQGATEIKYWSEGPRREGASYAIRAQPPAEEATAEVHRRLEQLGWKVATPPLEGTWKDITLRHRDGTSEAIRCWRQTWNRQGDALSYGLCTESAHPGLLRMLVWRRPS